MNFQVFRRLSRGTVNEFDEFASKKLSWEVSFAPAIAMPRYENGGLDTHVATPEFAGGFVRNMIFVYFQITKSSNSCEGLAF